MNTPNATVNSLSDLRVGFEIGRFDNSEDLYEVANQIGRLLGERYRTDDIQTSVSHISPPYRDIPLNEVIAQLPNVEQPVSYSAVVVQRRQPLNTVHMDRGSIVSVAEVAEFDQSVRAPASRIRSIYAETEPRAIRAWLGDFVLHKTFDAYRARLLRPETRKIFAGHPRTYR